MLDLDRHPRFRRLHDYLQAKAPPGKLPGRQHIDPMELADILPHVMLIDVERSPAAAPRYRVRLVGTAAVALQGEDTTGRYADEVLDKGGAILAGYADILATRQPQHHIGQIATTGREHRHYERIAFPLATDGETVDMLIFVFAEDLKPDRPRSA
jgi:hypothetical protein